MHLETLYRDIRRLLTDAGIESAAIEARMILKYVLTITDSDLIRGDINVSTEESQAVHRLIHRRIHNSEPLTRIFGEREFWGLPFRVTPDVLDPRPDTETIISTALNIFKKSPPKTILDLGTGSGCILISLLHEWKDSSGVAVDRSPAALNVAKDNAQRNNVADRIAFIEGDWMHEINQPFDLIVSNPPYIPESDIATLDREVKNHDPILALSGGKSGLDAYKTIFSTLKLRLNPSGRALFEIGFGQAKDVTRLAEDSGLFVIRTLPDLAGILRVVDICAGEN
jgi:release factor glutamine methyltransferase